MFFLLLLFFEGAIGLTYQLLFLRQLSPAVGSSNEVTGWIIGVFLGALSLGYKRGGQTSSAPLHQLGINLLLCAAIAGVAGSSWFIHLFFEAGTVLLPSRIMSLALYCALFVAPVAYMMGQSLPLLLQCNLRGRTVAEQGGNALSLSTIGSMAGAIIPTSLLAPWVGATNTLLINTALSIAIGCYLLQWKRKHIGLLCVALLSQAALLFPYYGFPELKFTSTAHSDIYLIEENEERMMYANGLVMSSQTPAGKNTAAYISSFQQTLQWQNIQQKDVLVLGAGGFMAHTENVGKNRFTYVDIDQALVEWATRHFKLDVTEVERIVHDDARSFLLQSKAQGWPVIFMDTFGSRFAMPEHLMTSEFFALVREKLSDNGVFIVNAILDPQFDTEFDRRFHETLSKEFPYCHVSQVTQDPGQANVMYTCFKRTRSGSYRDDRHTISKDVWRARNSS